MEPVFTSNATNHYQHRLKNVIFSLFIFSKSISRENSTIRIKLIGLVLLIDSSYDEPCSILWIPINFSKPRFIRIARDIRKLFSDTFWIRHFLEIAKNIDDAAMKII